MSHLLSWSEYMDMREAGSGIVEVEGDLLDVQTGIIAHQTNCLGVMGAGLALSVKRKHPEVFKKYRDYCIGMEPERLLGRVQVVEAGGLCVANLFGQNGCGRGERQTDYGALLNALLKLRKYAEEEDLPVAFPYELGCGLAGGDWKIVRQLIGIAFGDYRRLTAIVHLP